MSMKRNQTPTSSFSRRGRRRLRAASGLLLGLAAAGCLETSPTEIPVDDLAPSLHRGPATSVKVIMTGLESPRGLAFGPGGALYVAESGTSEVNGPCVSVARGENCFSGTGAITRYWRGTQKRIVSGLPSVYLAAASDISGPHHISFQGIGGMYVTIGWGGAPAARAGLGSHAHGLGTLVRITGRDRFRVVSDIAGFEDSTNPDGGLVDSNPYGLLAEPVRRFVTDAGGNSIMEARVNGRVSLVAVLPQTTVPAGPFNPPFGASEAVPTQIRRGPDGALYASTLTGAPFLPGAAGIWRVSRGSAPDLVVGGLTQVMDFAWDRSRALWVLQYGSAPFFGGAGSLVRVAPDGTRTTVVSDLARPTGLAIGPDGAVYVAQNHHVPGEGEVLRIVP